jgi:hypothetical protein
MTPGQRARWPDRVRWHAPRLCLQTRYLDAVEQERAKTTAFQYLNERWTFGDENLETSRWLILSKRPDDKKGKPRADLVPGGARSRLLKDSQGTAKFWKSPSGSSALSRAGKTRSGSSCFRCCSVGASHYGYVQRQEVEVQLIGWRLNASAMDWCWSTRRRPSKKASTTASSAALPFGRGHAEPAEPRAVRLRGPGTHGPGRCRPPAVAGAALSLHRKDRRDWLENPAHEAPLERLPVMFCSPTMELGVDISALNTVYLRNVPPTPPTTRSAAAVQAARASRRW